jgi:glucose/arabinose dehydrogenase
MGTASAHRDSKYKVASSLNGIRRAHRFADRLRRASRAGTVPVGLALGLWWLGAQLPAHGAGDPRDVARSAQAPAGQTGGCSNDAGLTLPRGFCASIFADDLGQARHIAVAANGVVYVNTWGSDEPRPPRGGYLIALRDSRGTGRADMVKRFGPTKMQGGQGGTGIGIYNGWLFAEEKDRIERYALRNDSIVPKGPPVDVVEGLPLDGDHPMHPFVIDRSGNLYVDVGSATNSCQSRNRQRGSPGISPCRELEKRGGTWRFDANKTGQRSSPRDRYATGIRNGEGLTLDASGQLYTTQHGRDQLYQNWPELYRPEQEATQPAEELMRVTQGGDYGWPECYYDEAQGKLVLAPEYGGDGGHKVGICAQKLAPLASFPAHWAPNGAVIYTSSRFPERYHNGVFIAFHGSWDRAPYPQGGYNIVFQPLAEGRASGRCEVFADGFAGPVREPGAAKHRPSGVAVGPDGALYVSDDVRGRIYRIVWTGGVETGGGSGVTPCPPADAPAGITGIGGVLPPERVHPHAGEVENLPVPAGSSHRLVALGDEIFHGGIAHATCTVCHGPDGSGTPTGPALKGPTWLWSDGSYQGLKLTIAQGVAHPRHYGGTMPPMGGAQLTPEQASAVAAYVWALGHQRGTRRSP